jgi:hypothetical protein
MSNHKKIVEDSAAFFNKEVDKVILKTTRAKTEKSRLKYLKQLIALKNRITLEVKMLGNFDNF